MDAWIVWGVGAARDAREAEEEALVDEALRLAELEEELIAEALGEERQDLVRALLKPLREGGMGRPTGGVAEAIEEEAARWARSRDDRDALLERRALGGGQAVLDAIDALVDALEEGEAVRCQCGATGGDECEWVGPKSDTVRVRWVDPSMRGTAGAARTWRGVSSVIRVTRECADLILADEGEWAEILEEVTT